MHGTESVPALNCKQAGNWGGGGESQCGGPVRLGEVQRARIGGELKE